MALSKDTLTDYIKEEYSKLGLTPEDDNLIKALAAAIVRHIVDDAEVTVDITSGNGTIK